MLVGQETFEEETADWENIIRNGRRLDISIIQCFHPEASKIISKAIEPDPLYRYITATDMFNDLYNHYQQLTGTKTELNLTFICDNGKQIKIPKGTYNIGRRDIGYEKEYVSERHLLVDFDNQKAQVKDAGSTNGTRLNGQSINGQWISVRDGDILTLANCNLLVNLTD